MNPKTVYPRATQVVSMVGVPINAGAQIVGTQADSTSPVLGFPVNLVTPTAPLLWPLTWHLVYRFSGCAAISADDPTGAQRVTIESASLVADLGTNAAPRSLTPYLCPAPVSGLAAGKGVMWEPWEVDCDDILQAVPTAQNFMLFMAFMVMNPDTAVYKFQFLQTLTSEAALFPATRPSVWK